MNKMVRLEPVEANKGIYGKRPLEEVRVVKTIRDMFDSSCELFADNVAYLQKDKPGGEYREIKILFFSIFWQALPAAGHFLPPGPSCRQPARTRSCRTERRRDTCPGTTS